MLHYYQLPPFSLVNFASSQFATARMFAKDETMAPDTLIFLISEEYEAQKKQRNQDDGGKRKEIDEAMAVDLSSWKESGNGNGKKRKKYGRVLAGTVAR